MGKKIRKIKHIRIHREGNNTLTYSFILITLIAVALWYGFNTKWPFWLFLVVVLPIWSIVLNFYRCPVRYLNLEDTIKAISDLSTAIGIKPDENSLYDKRAQIYYEQEKYDLADADYKKMIDLKPGETMGYMGIGRNANAQKRWDDAIKQFDYVTKLASDYSSGYSFRAESYIGKEKWSEATDDIVTALSLDWDRKALYLAGTLKEPAFTMLVSKIKIKSAKSPNEATWPYIIGTMYEENKQYEKAIEYYNKAADIIDKLEQRHVISAPLPGGQKRTILITDGLETPND